MNTHDWTIHHYLAEESDKRLEWVNAQPKTIILIGADGDHSRTLLAKRYPNATFSEYDHRANYLQAASTARKTGWLAKLTGKNIPQFCQNPLTPLPENAADMLWANLSLLAHPDTAAVLSNWARAIKPEGLLFFTHFGIDSLSTLRSLLAEHGITFTPQLPDMHDLGDILASSAFYDPVMDTARLTLTYQNAATFWQDMDTIGLLPYLNLDESARTIIDTAIHSGRLPEIDLEILYGHAVKKNVLPNGAQPIRFFNKSPTK